MKTIKEAYKHLQEERSRNAKTKEVLNWWDNLPITTQQTLFWKYKGIKNICVKQFINDYDKLIIYQQQH